MSYRLAVDVGGTFMGEVLVGPDGRSAAHEVPSTPYDDSRGILEVVQTLPAAQRADLRREGTHAQASAG